MKIALAFLITFFCSSLTFATAIKDLASVVGVRDNQLIGYGLVVGLNGSGDGSTSEFTIQSLSNMLQTVNVKIDPNDIKSKNTAAVIVTAKLPAFARSGDKIDVSVSSIGDAKSLEGGTLLMTPLKAVDGDIYALAQGSLTIGGKSEGRGGGNHPTNASIFAGAFVEKEVAYDFYNQNLIKLSLKDTNFKTAVNIQNTINANLSSDVAKAIDPRTVVIRRPIGENIIEMMSKILNYDVEYTAEDKVVIDERSGTIISGVNVAVDPVVLTHKDITIKIEPNSFAQKADDEVDLDDGSSIATRSNMLKISGEKSTIASITRALNKLGATPSDIIAILENLKRAGAIHVPLEII